MRIAIIVDTFPSLSETFISNKVERLALKGNEVVVFCNKKDNQLYTQLFNNEKRVKTVLLNKKKILVYSFLRPFILLRSFLHRDDIKQTIYRSFRVFTINKHKPDIIHFEFSGIGIDYLYEIKFLKALKIVSCRGSAEKVKLLIYDDRKEKFRNLLNLVDRIHCVSNNIRETILPYCKENNKIFINYPSIDTTFFERRSENKNGKILTIL
ncbi:MAG TPA: glycosyltransferase, partial [Chitinophagaceae bacterium]|nr:glycosyltransferase [Chitinophagaceae bacterium]